MGGGAAAAGNKQDGRAGQETANPVHHFYSRLLPALEVPPSPVCSDLWWFCTVLAGIMHHGFGLLARFLVVYLAVWVFFSEVLALLRLPRHVFIFLRAVRSRSCSFYLLPLWRGAGLRLDPLCKQHLVKSRCLECVCRNQVQDLYLMCTCKQLMSPVARSRGVSSQILDHLEGFVFALGSCMEI